MFLFCFYDLSQKIHKWKNKPMHFMKILNSKNKIFWMITLVFIIIHGSLDVPSFKMCRNNLTWHSVANFSSLQQSHVSDKLELTMELRVTSPSDPLAPASEALGSQAFATIHSFCCLWCWGWIPGLCTC